MLTLARECQLYNRGDVKSGFSTQDMLVLTQHDMDLFMNM